MRYPNWKDFEAKYSENPQGAFESLCRMLFRRKYGKGDTLPYFYNNAGNETVDECTTRARGQVHGTQHLNHKMSRRRFCLLLAENG